MAHAQQHGGHAAWWHQGVDRHEQRRQERLVVPATACTRGCNRMWQRLQPHVSEAATLGVGAMGRTGGRRTGPRRRRHPPGRCPRHHLPRRPPGG
eukprot:scaffold127726_cov48-Phaeocystis_antarctica.AAC.2